MLHRTADRGESGVSSIFALYLLCCCRGAYELKVTLRVHQPVAVHCNCDCLLGSTGMARLTLTGMLLCGALFAGCGDSGAGGEGSKERFIADGDRLCVKLGERLKGSSKLANSPAALVRTASGYRDLTRDLSAGLAKSAPDADAAAKRIVDDSAKLATIARRQKLRAKQIVARQRGDDLASAQRLGRAYNRTAGGSQLTLANRLDARMRDYGFRSCGRNA